MSILHSLRPVRVVDGVVLFAACRPVQADQRNATQDYRLCTFDDQDITWSPLRAVYHSSIPEPSASREERPDRSHWAQSARPFWQAMAAADSQS